MNKEEFQTKKNDINSKIRELKSQKIKLEKEYIESMRSILSEARCVLLLMNQNDMPMSRIIGLIFLTILYHCLTR